MNLNTVENQIDQEVTRALARYDFWEFCQWVDPEFFTNNRPHLKQIADIFMRVYRKEVKKVAISIWPRTGKSYITTLFCAWMLGLNPTGAIMRNSYSELLAYKFSYDVRDIVKGDKYRQVFPHIQLSNDKTAVTGWNLETAKQVSYFCAGVGGSITGFGCDILAVLDDPLKNLEEAMSELILDKKWGWYTSTHRSRMEGSCPEIHIATRWGKKDIIGRLLEMKYFDEIIEIPALTNGKSYCEEIISTSDLLEIKRLNDRAIWEAVYQQHPIDIEGRLFPYEKLNKFTLAELHGTPDGIMAACDIAGEGTDYLAMPIGFVYGQKIFIVDVIFTQRPVEVTEKMCAERILKWGVQKAVFESNAGGDLFARNVQRDIKELSKCAVEWKPTTKSKDVRIFIKSGQIKETFYFRTDGSDEYEKFMSNVTSYISGGKNAHDDGPDSITMLSEMFDKPQYFWG
jgi:predicted phage terminase large subunit-like protein